MVNTRLEQSEVVEALFYLKLECFIDLEAIDFRDNLAHERAVISTRWNSFFSLNNANFTGNRAVNNSALIYIVGPPFLRYFDEDKVS